MNDRESQALTAGEQLRAYVELLRLPNLFTAAADAAMGFLFTRPLLDETDQWQIGLLAAASACLYAAGIVLNDFFDRDLDAVERPERPIPSGRVPAAVACRFGVFLLVLGVAVAAGLSWQAASPRPIVTAGLLAACVVLYDGLLKRTPLGPLAMGACRMLNVLLGMSLAAGPWNAANLLAAGAVGTYVVGLTWFARRETETGRRIALSAATLVLLAGIAMAAPLPALLPHIPATIQQEPWRWYALLGMLGVLISWRFVAAIVRPTPRMVQAAVAGGVLSITVLDAAICYAARDLQGAISVLCFLIAATIASRLARIT